MKNSVMKKIGGWWCKLMHDEPMWPVNGKYICRSCLRAHPVGWSNSASPVLVPASAGLRRLHPVKAQS
jgi:hypothetical protein